MSRCPLNTFLTYQSALRGGFFRSLVPCCQEVKNLSTLGCRVFEIVRRDNLTLPVPSNLHAAVTVAPLGDRTLLLRLAFGAQKLHTGPLRISHLLHRRARQRALSA